ncbi:unnamed protein product [Lupinus luteus]|uniref:S-protein homolog n=1 Tax=Lupinus luteus TaxID=3873 RepID=A0AAV1WR56_LUPLU
MAQLSTHVLLFSFISIGSLVSVSEGGIERFKYNHIYIKNGLGQGTPLTIHCKSRDDDLGVHVLNYDEEWKFQFQINFRQSTLFFCGFTWDGKLHWFDIYDWCRDKSVCMPDCKWSITKENPCLYDNDTQQYDLCYYGYH